MFVFFCLPRGELLSVYKVSDSVSLSLPPPPRHVLGARGRCFSARASLEVGPLSLSAATPGVPWAAAPHVGPLGEGGSHGRPSDPIIPCAFARWSLKSELSLPLSSGFICSVGVDGGPIDLGTVVCCCPCFDARVVPVPPKSLCGLKRPCSSVSTVFGTCVPGSLCPCPGLGCYLRPRCGCRACPLLLWDCCSQAPSLS